MALITALVYALHQDFWLWRSARPLVFGFLPVGLAYHATYTLGIAVLMAALVKYRWPSHLEDDANERQGAGRRGGTMPPARQ